MSLNDHEPAPTPRPDLVPVWESVIEDIVKRNPITGSPRRLIDLVLEDIRERDAVGRKRYGTPLTTHNGRDPVVDAYQELLDAVVYTRQAMLEGAALMDIIYERLLHDVVIVRRVIEDRKDAKKT